jgi:anti-sigma factor RsiW
MTTHTVVPPVADLARTPIRARRLRRTPWLLGALVTCIAAAAALGVVGSLASAHSPSLVPPGQVVVQEPNANAREGRVHVAYQLQETNANARESRGVR